MIFSGVFFQATCRSPRRCDQNLLVAIKISAHWAFDIDDSSQILSSKPLNSAPSNDIALSSIPGANDVMKLRIVGRCWIRFVMSIVVQPSCCRNAEPSWESMLPEEHGVKMLLDILPRNSSCCQVAADAKDVL